MANSKFNNYQNLLSITTVVFVLAIISNIVSLAKQYPPEYVKFDSAKPSAKVQGYVRPDKLQPKTNNKPVKQINLLAGLSEPQKQLLQQRFDQAIALLHAKQFEYAIIALDEVIKIQPRLPEAHVNLGFSYLGLKQYPQAVQSFARAIDLRPEQVNAYFGLAESYEALNDYESALGAMRSYIHLSPADDPFLARARAAVWEWETKLGRKPQIEATDPAMQFDSKRFVSPHNR